MALNRAFECTCVPVHILYFLFTVGSSKYVLNEKKKKKDKLRQTLNLNHLLKVQNKTETFLKFFQKEM